MFFFFFFVKEKFEVGRLLSVRSGKSEQATIYCLRHKKVELKKLLLKLKKKKKKRIKMDAMKTISEKKLKKNI